MSSPHASKIQSIAPNTQPSTKRDHDPSWTLSSWRNRPSVQQPVYPDAASLARTLGEISALPPLVTSYEVEALKSALAEAARGERFILWGGDCAENFADCTSAAIASRLKILLQMSLVLVHGTRKRIIRIGRFAGQYAKPRSTMTETRDGVELPCFRGDNVNRPEFTSDARTPDPSLLLRGYERSALTLNFVRALVDGGFADLHHPENWDLDFVKHSPLAAEYQHMVDSIGESLRFMETLAGSSILAMQRVDFYTSHELLVLEYEAALTRQVPRREGWFNLSTHLPWVGLRTSDPDGAHIEFCRGISNPVGVKVGPDTSAEALLRTIRALNPTDEAGRVVLVTRFGAHQIGRGLPPLLRAVRDAQVAVVWVCDPMHGNTEAVVPTTGAWAGKSVKTRKFAHILAEVEQAFEIHRNEGTVLAGVHIELTGEDVTECTGGARGLTDDDLSRAYRSSVDPRLNYEQALELAMLIARRAGAHA
ncbi:MAG: 3-deoxy-7-phosphoheptulonate synthase [Phycisphaerales bacterium]|nr:3-deoxy-7-phosphoheptulonate synthase [Phycisphaerales bacterium]